MYNLFTSRPSSLLQDIGGILMNIETRELKHVTVVKPIGRIDSATAPELERSLQGLLNADRSQIVLDLQEADYMSSAGLRVLVAQQKAAHKHGGALRLAQPTTRVREAIDLAGLTSVLAIYSDLLEAVGSF
jgi:anti-anti-sigma factor